MLIYTRCYNKHSITEYLINSISIYQLFVCQDGLNRPGRPLCAVRTYDPFQSAIYDSVC